MLIQVPTTNRSIKFIPIVIILSTNPCVTKAPAGVPYLGFVFEIRLRKCHSSEMALSKWDINSISPLIRPKLDV